VAEGERTHTKRQSHTDTIHKQQVRYGTSACLRLVSMARTRSPVLVRAYRAGRGVKLKAESWAECGAVACGRWRRRGDSARAQARIHCPRPDLGQEDAYSIFWSDTDRNRLTGHSRPRQSISKCAREIGRTGHRGQSISKVKSLRTRHGRTGKSVNSYSSRPSSALKYRGSRAAACPYFLYFSISKTHCTVLSGRAPWFH
jgi:hypothetical protein